MDDSISRSVRRVGSVAMTLVLLGIVVVGCSEYFRM